MRPGGAERTVEERLLRSEAVGALRCLANFGVNPGSMLRPDMGHITET